jgi:hypothetical protein
MSSTMQRSARMASVIDRAGARAGVIDGAAAAFGVSAAITIVFNTLLAWVKDAYDPLNTFMASLSGHHWTTHGLTDVAVFLIVGFVLMKRGISIDGTRLALLVAGAAIAGGGGLALWFLVT